MNKATISSPYSSVLNAQPIAIFISLTIHLGLILIFLMIPATKVMHQPQTIQIRFYNPSEFSTDSRKMSAAKLSKPDAIVLKDNIKTMALKPVHKDIPQETSVQKNSEIIIAEKTLPDEKPFATQNQNTTVLPEKSKKTSLALLKEIFKQALSNPNSEIMDLQHSSTRKYLFIRHWLGD